ncbi:MAG: acetate--CoA ligase, partial [Bacteroidota bacterium]
MNYPYQIRTHDQYLNAYQDAANDPEAFWSGVAEHFRWKRKWDKVLEWNFEEPRVEWFKGAQLNITENCLDRHLDARGDQPALIFEPN